MQETIKVLKDCDEELIHGCLKNEAIGTSISKERETMKNLRLSNLTLSDPHRLIDNLDVLSDNIMSTNQRPTQSEGH